MSADKPVAAKNNLQNHLINIEESKENFTLNLTARKFAQGEVFVVKIREKKPIGSVTINWDKKKYIASKYNHDFISFIPIDPEFKSDTGTLTVITRKGFTSAKHIFQVKIAKTKFREYASLTLPSKYTSNSYSKKALAFIKKCTEEKKKAFSKARELLIRGNFIYPVKDTTVNSNFYARRKYNKVKSSPHRGVDLKGKKGDPIYAIQDGKVELAKKMYFEGKLTIINHGNKVYSLYMHQSKVLVKKGDNVKKGDLIGQIGSTGMSTGPHLHLAVKVEDTYIDPVSLIALNVF